MSGHMTRRAVLRAALVGSLGGVLAACSRGPGEQAQAPTIAAPTVAPAAPAPTSAPAPTAAPATAPAPTVAPAAPAPTVALAAPAPTAEPAPTAAPAAPTAALAQAALVFLESLDGERRDQASYAFADPERVRWHWTTPSGFPRNGLPLRDMSQPQRDLALALLQQSLSAQGFQKALDIMSLQRDLGGDPELYFVTVFGDPQGSEPWGWRWEGHHLSRHYTVANGALSATPFFHGAWPTTADSGLRAMPREEDAARELISSLEGPARDAAIFQTRTLTQHVTQNQPQVAALEPVGIGYADLGAPQQQLVVEIIQSYLGTQPEAVSAALLSRIQSAGLEQLRFGWAGPLEPRKPHYYRIQGPTFLLEFDNSRNGGTHIHSVWRDFSEDFGQHLL